MRNCKESHIQVKIRNLILTFGIAIAILLLSFLPVFGQDSGSATKLSESEKVAVRNLQSIAEVAANLVAVYMDARITETLACSLSCERLNDASGSPETRDDIQKYLESWLKASGSYEAVLFIDKDGNCIAAAPAGLVNRNLSGDSTFKEALAGKLSISDFHKSDMLVSVDPQSKGWTLAIAAPVRSGADLKGVVMSLLKWSRLTELMRIRVGETGYVYALDNQRRVIIHPSDDFYGVNMQKVGAPAALDTAVSKKLTHVSYEFQSPGMATKTTRLVGLAYPKGFGNLPDLGWAVGATAPQSEIVGGHPLWNLLFRLFR